MPELTQIKLYGFDELEKALMQLPIEIEKKIAVQAMVKAARMTLVPKARSLIRRETGILQASIDAWPATRKKSAYSLMVLVGPSRKKKGYHAHLVEYGTKKHEISVRRMRVSYFGRAGAIRGERFAAMSVPGIGAVSKVEHPGAKPHPFMSTAYDQMGKVYIAAVGNIMGPEIEKAFEKLNMARTPGGLLVGTVT